MLETKTILGKGGRLVIPASFRKALGLKPGDDLIVILDEGELRIVTPAQAARRARALVRRFIGEGTKLVDELLADRREESSRE